MKAAILTAVYDNYDPLKDIAPQPLEVERICVTDNPHLVSHSWKVIYDPRPGVHPNRAAKRPKMCPWLYTDADVSIWIDASFKVLSTDFVEQVLAYLPLGQFLHWDRQCIYKEGDYSIGLGKYSKEPIKEQMADYLDRGHPQEWGLWATGLIVRAHTSKIRSFGEAWLAENEKWSFQDQVSEPVVLREHGLRPQTIPGNYSQNPWLQYAGSSRH